MWLHVDLLLSGLSLTAWVPENPFAQHVLPRLQYVSTPPRLQCLDAADHRLRSLIVGLQAFPPRDHPYAR